MLRFVSIHHTILLLEVNMPNLFFTIEIAERANQNYDGFCYQLGSWEVKLLVVVTCTILNS